MKTLKTLKTRERKHSARGHRTSARLAPVAGEEGLRVLPRVTSRRPRGGEELHYQPVARLGTTIPTSHPARRRRRTDERPPRPWTSGGGHSLTPAGGGGEAAGPGSVVKSHSAFANTETWTVPEHVWAAFFCDRGVQPALHAAVRLELNPEKPDKALVSCPLCAAAAGRRARPRSPRTTRRIARR